MAHSNDALLTDLYELKMLAAYRAAGMCEVASFEFFSRKLPATRGFLLASGIEQSLEFLERLHFDDDEVDWLRAREDLSRDDLEALRGLRFTGDVDAVPEGTVVFEHEPLVRVSAPILEAQLVETRLMNIIHFETSIASKAARIVLVAPEKLLVDFGGRRAHGLEAAVLAARASYIAGFSGTSTVLAGERFAIPLFGTMAHSFVQAHEDELEAFRNFARTNPGSAVFLIDTYDTEEGARKVVRLAREGIRAQGVRIDSGDLASHAMRVRRILDEGGLERCSIFASGGLNEILVREMLAAGAPIDGFGIGSRLDTSADAPYLDCAYKLVEYAGQPRRKRSEGKASWPGRKQVFRTYLGGTMSFDTITLVGERAEGEPLLVPMMREGKRVRAQESLDMIRARAAKQLASLPAQIRALAAAPGYSVRIAPALRSLATELDARSAK